MYESRVDNKRGGKEMLVNEWDERRTAKNIAHYIYRNTDFENLHAEGITMDMTTYEFMKKIMRKQINKWKRNIEMICNITEENCRELYEPLNWWRKLDFKSFYDEMGFLHKGKWGSSWVDAVEVEPPTKKDLTEYILSGKFLEFCQSGAKLTDSTMRELNRDIHNRVYTLVVNNLIPSRKAYAQC